ncbi:MAG: histidine--tRNA ligase [Gammaproteobacteria bacterium]|nr:histidine--tRNA ligase [Gammaproteobacteria bacterium]HAN81158.1 histidine--tRNA ligase [Gammaproteobacteria bacterium]
MRIQSVRGMSDILPDQVGAWRYLEQIVQRIFSAYGLTQIRTPIVEDTELFARSIGNVTDIVEKEMYTFEDRSGDSLTLRPELTAGVVRAAIEHGLLHNQTQRLWYQGQAFRHERPQKGRYRQFHQIGVECFGIADALMDAELIEITDQIWKELGIRDCVTLQINSIGSTEARAKYRTALIDFLAAHKDQLDRDSLARLERSPLRVLDSKNDSTQALLRSAPSLMDYLTEADREHFDLLRRALKDADIGFAVNPLLVRGLDYYSRTVFEWTTEALGSQGTICGGGRYDGLVDHLGGKSTPGVGFALGMERVVLLMEALAVIPDTYRTQADVYLMPQKQACEEAIRKLARLLRQEFPSLRVLTHIGGGSLKSQLKRADKSGALFGLIIGQSELESGHIVCKPLRGGEQETLSEAGLLKRMSILRDS